MKANYTRQELQHTLEILRENFLEVYCVDPKNGQVMDEETLEPIPEEKEPVTLPGAAELPEGKNQVYRFTSADGRMYEVNTRRISVDGRKLNLVIGEIIEDEGSEQEDALDAGVLVRGVEAYRNAVYHDFLTGAYNRRYLEERYVPYLRRCVAKKTPVHIAMVMVNENDSIHDAYGREAADRLKGTVAGMLQHMIDMEKDDGAVVRYSGSCFCISCVGYTKEHFQECLRKMNSTFPRTCMVSMSRRVPFTLSIGVASWEEGSDWIAVRNQADAGMREANKKGELGI